MKAIPDFEGYFITEDGRVWSDRQSGKWLKPAPSNGYLTVVLMKDCKRYTKKVHVLVATTFHGSKPSRESCVRHLDGNPLNNHVSNLKWGTLEENSADKVLHGTDGRGSKNPRARLTEDPVVLIRELLKSSEMTRVDIGKMFGVSKHLIFDIEHGRSWKFL